MKSILMSIKPKWIEKIASGEKTVEVRKTVPKCGTPFKVYMYCTKAKSKDDELFKGACSIDPTLCNGKVVGEFVCDKIEYFDSAWSELAYAVAPSGSISSSIMPMHEDTAIKLCETKGAMTLDDIIAYFEDEEWKAHFWHISELKIYDKPKELSEFKNVKKVRGYHKSGENKAERLMHADRIKVAKITRPPMSWCYVEEL